MNTSNWVYNSESKGVIPVEEMHPIHIVNARRKRLREAKAKGVDPKLMGDIVSLSVEANRRHIKDESLELL